jgi:hypothetical protein
MSSRNQGALILLVLILGISMTGCRTTDTKIIVVNPFRPSDETKGAMVVMQNDPLFVGIEGDTTVYSQRDCAGMILIPRGELKGFVEAERELERLRSLPKE